MSAELSRITIVTETYAPEVNGVAHTLSPLVAGMRGCGIQVQIIRPKQNKNDTGDEHTLTLPGLPLPGYPELKFGLPYFRRVKTAIREFQPEAIYVATEGPLGWIARKVADKLDIGVVSGFHTNFHQYGKHYRLGLLENLGYRYLRWFHNNTAATLVPTQQQANELLSHGFERVKVMARGVDSQHFSPAHRDTNLRKSWGVSDDTPVLLYVGRIAAEKNLQLVVRTYEELRTQDQNIRLVLVGDGPELESIRQRHPDVISAGIQRGEALARYYASGDIFLFPSLTDTFGNVVTEALASGLGVVSFDYAAAHEHTRHEESAMLAPFGDEQAFIRAAMSLSERPNLLKKLRSAAREKATTISWTSIVDEFLQHLNDAQNGVIKEVNTDGRNQATGSKSRVSVPQSGSL
ncbi:MAG: glycosyltransferase family 1 protein [Thalassolituus sp.]